MDLFDSLEKNLVTPRDKIKKESAKVGQAVADILKKDNSPVEVQEIIDEYKDDYTKEMENTLRANADRYMAPFHVVVLTKKEPWAVNVVRNWFIARQTRPKASWLRSNYPNYLNTVYSYNQNSGELKILWSLPSKQESEVVLQNSHLYDPQLVKWIEDYNSGALDRAA